MGETDVNSQTHLHTHTQTHSHTYTVWKPSPDDSTEAKVKSLTSVLLSPALRRGGEEKESAREETSMLKWPACRQPITSLPCCMPGAHWPPGERGVRDVE